MAEIIQFRQRRRALYPAIDVLPVIQMAQISIIWTAVMLLAVAAQLEQIEESLPHTKGADRSPR
jgi:hypothetical protein